MYAASSQSRTSADQTLAIEVHARERELGGWKGMDQEVELFGLRSIATAKQLQNHSNVLERGKKKGKIYTKGVCGGPYSADECIRHCQFRGGSGGVRRRCADATSSPNVGKRDVVAQDVSCCFKPFQCRFPISRAVICLAKSKQRCSVLRVIFAKHFLGASA